MIIIESAAMLVPGLMQPREIPEEAELRILRDPGLVLRQSPSQYDGGSEVDGTGVSGAEMSVSRRKYPQLTFILTMSDIPSQNL